MNGSKTAAGPRRQAAAAEGWKGEAPGPRTPDQTEANLSFYLFLGGAIAGLIQLTYPVEFGTGFEMVAIGKNIAKSGSFANPYAVAATGATAAVPPAYPFFLGILNKVLRNQAAVFLVAVICNIVVNALAASLLPKLSRVIFRDLLPGVIGGAFWLATAHLMPSWDTSYTVAGLILFCLMSELFLRERRSVILHGAGAGALAGLLSLLNPSAILVLLPWLAYLVLRRIAPLRAAVVYAAIIIAAMAMVDTGWMWRNYKQLGAFVLRTNLGMTLYASNNDCASSSLISNERSGCYQAHHPNTSAAEAELVRTLGEVAYDRLRVANAKQWAVSNPVPFTRLTAKRFWEFWFPPAELYPYSAAAIWIVTALSIPGLIIMGIRREPILFFMVTVSVVYPLLYYLVVTDMRYRYPILWLSCIAAGYACTGFGTFLVTHRRTRQRIEAVVE